MTASELFKAGRLQDAIDAQILEVKKAPGDHGKRLFLFEMLSFAGDLDKAGRQIQAVKYDNAETDAAVNFYARLIDAEQTRRKVFKEGIKPQFLIDPPESVKLRLEAVSRLRENNHAEAQRLLGQANGQTTIKGRLNEKSFESLRDCDDLFGTMLEVMAHGDYFWLPLEQVEMVVMNPPKFPRDLLWVPARLEVRDGPKGDVFLPATYPFSHEDADDQIRLGRSTDWRAGDDGPVRGVGLRTFLMDDDVVSILEWRELEIEG